jgi:hypothetical protein
MKRLFYLTLLFFFLLFIPISLNANGGFFYDPIYSLGSIDSAVQQALISYD